MTATIEVRGSGPFVCDPVVVRGKALTVRAGGGFRPVLRLSPEGNSAAAPLLDTDAPLVLEGLELQRVGEVSWSGKPPPRTVSCRGAALRVANCRFLLRTDGAGLAAEECPACEVLNCEFVDTGRSLGQVTVGLPTSGRLRMENCVAAGQTALALWHIPRDTNDFSVRLAHNSLAVREPLLLLLNRQPNLESAAPPLRLEVSENVLHGQDTLLNIRQWDGFLAGGRARPSAEVVQLLPRLVAWRPERNLYRPAEAFLTLSTIAEQPPRPAPGVRGLAGWKRLWGTADGESRERRPRFQGGDPLARSSRDPERLSAADFRLDPDSPGKGACKSGRDLGADVDLVGPGVAYERWKKTPAYQRWLGETGRSRPDE